MYVLANIQTYLCGQSVGLYGSAGQDFPTPSRHFPNALPSGGRCVHHGLRGVSAFGSIASGDEEPLVVDDGQAGVTVWLGELDERLVLFSPLLLTTVRLCSLQSYYFQPNGLSTQH